MLTFDFGRYFTGNNTSGRTAEYTNIPIGRLIEFRMRYKGFKMRYRGPRDTALDIKVRQRGVLNRQSNCLIANAKTFSVYRTGL